MFLVLPEVLQMLHRFLSLVVSFVCCVVGFSLPRVASYRKLSIAFLSSIYRIMQAMASCRHGPRKRSDRTWGTELP